MSDSTIELTTFDVFTAAGLVFVAGAVSLALRLGLERRLAHAAVRTIIQLLLVGYVLKWVFALNNVYALFAVLGVMLVAASRAAVQRSERTFAGATLQAFVTLVICGLLTTFSVTLAIIHVKPWYDPRYTIPLLGMVLGNSLTGISLCLDHILEAFTERRAYVEMELAHGATAWEASHDALSSGVRRGMIPIVNAMMVVGVVSLPGMMTGQILAGADPLDAVKYQIIVMFMIAAATSMGCMIMAVLVQRTLFNKRHQLRSDRIFRKVSR